MRFEPGRIKEAGERLRQKTDALGGRGQLIRDYLAGRLIPSNDKGVDGALEELGKRFEIVDVKDSMEEPDPITGYTAIHVQVRLPSGITAEVQVQPEPFKRAAEAQREIFEKYREYAGKPLPDDLEITAESDMRKSRDLFAEAWREWIVSGNADRRVGLPFRPIDPGPGSP